MWSIKAVAVGKKPMRKKGFTLLEIIISLVILALTMAGLTNLFISGKRWLLHSRSRMAGGELGKYFLDPLQMDVTQGQKSPGAQDGWGQTNNCLTTGTNCPGAQTINNILYTPAYQNSALLADAQNPLGRLRKVKVDITWPKD